MKAVYAITKDNVILDRSGQLTHREAQTWRDLKLRQGSRMVQLFDTRGHIGDRVLIDEDGVAITVLGQIESKLDRGVYQTLSQLRDDLLKTSRLPETVTHKIFKWMDENAQNEFSFTYQYRVFLNLHKVGLSLRSRK